jgi:CDP-glycerol glycerophosphotransferase
VVADLAAAAQVAEHEERSGAVLRVESGGEPLRLAPSEPVWERGGPHHRVRLEVGPGGEALVVASVASAVARRFEVTDDALLVDVSLDGLGVDEVDPALVAPSTLARGSWAGDGEAEGTVRMRLPFRGERFGVPDQVLRSTTYRLMLVGPDASRRVQVRMDGAAMWQSPYDATVPDLRCRVHLRVRKPGVAVTIEPPTPLDERRRSQQSEFRALATADRPRERSVFFRTLYGEAANDSAAAVHHELVRRGTDLTLYWSVADLSVPVPEGGVPLLEGTREWHERLGAAAYAMFNVHQPAWYTKPAGQVMLQTFHGYPYKGMGVEWWQRSGLPADRITSFLERAADWDYLVSPASYATPLLLEAFVRAEDRDGLEVLECGYPRNDILVGDGDGRGDDVRRRTREALGLRDDQVAVLYAPTFRDYMSIDGMTALTDDFFDHRLVGRLGPRYVVLHRGHAFHARNGAPLLEGDQVVDVTYYPDVSDLMLASDAAVLDYSSLRFDYALMRKPMVFLVPDVEEYHRLRPAVLDYDATAPGPHVQTTAQVVKALADLDGLRTRYADRVETFLRTYCDLDDGHAAERLVDRVFEEGR